MAAGLADPAGQLRPLHGTLYRLVESQQQVATLGYVDTLEEQAVLEVLLERSKPPLPAETEGYHYLLRTPFRYPPLRHGSRFGGRDEAGIFYAGLDRQATLAEAAYYRFVFWSSMAVPPPKAVIRSEHSLFSVPYRSRRGISLQAPPYRAARAELASPVDYGPAQALGRRMRAAGVEAFEYFSARDVDGGCCIGLFTPRAFARRAPSSIARWFCELGAERVSFKPAAERDIHHFPRQQFLVEGKLPMPA